MPFTKKQAENAIYDNFIKNSQKCNLFLFSGNLGTGKTFYISKILEKKFKINEVTSPTYTIINTYEKELNILYHADLYRLKDEIELFETGFCDIIKENKLMFIEWPENFIEFFNQFNYVMYKLKESSENEKRELEIYENFIY